MASEKSATPRSFSDLKWELEAGIANLKVLDLLDQEIVITAVESATTSFGEAIRFSFSLNGHDLQALTHSVVLKKQFEAIQGDLPVSATLRKTGRSYTLS